MGLFNLESIARKESSPAGTGSFLGAELQSPLFQRPGELSRPEYKLKDYK